MGFQACCFAGTDDELVISVADDHNLFIWSLPGQNGGDGHAQIVDQLLTILKGHKDEIRCVPSNKEQSAIASCGIYGVIKWWTPATSQ